MGSFMEIAANQLLDKLIANQFEAYLVGGCVRDRLMDKQIKDYDIATNALPQQVMDLFAHTIPTGLKHGTVTVVMNGLPFEVTTYRTETAYEEHRRPQQVEFVSDLNQDLMRRDFTINSMAMDAKGRVIDPFNGQADIKLKMIRCVGNPNERLQEDALRMLRCIRFAVNYSFEIEQMTWTALLQHVHLLSFIAMERVRAELEKMLASDQPLRAIELLLESKLLSHLKQELELPLSKWQVEQLPSYLTKLTDLEEPMLRWALLFHSLNISVENVNRALKKLTFSKKQIQIIVPVLKLENWLQEQLALALQVQHLPEKNEPVSLSAARLTVDRPDLIWKRAAIQFGKDVLTNWLKVKQIEYADLLHLDGVNDLKQAAFRSFIRHGMEWISEMPVETLNELAISGNDLVLYYAIPAGPWVSDVLQRLLLDAALGNARNQKSHLLQRAEIYRKELKNND